MKLPIWVYRLGVLSIGLLLGTNKVRAESIEQSSANEQEGLSRLKSKPAIDQKNTQQGSRIRDEVLFYCGGDQNLSGAELEALKESFGELLLPEEMRAQCLELLETQRAARGTHVDSHGALSFKPG